MRKIIIISAITTLHCFLSKGQTSLYDFIKPGYQQVGYLDTLLFDSSYSYEAYGYKGKKPQFIQIWYPLPEKPANSSFLSFKDFYGLESYPGLKTVQLELSNHYREAITRDCLEENLLTGKTNDFGGLPYPEVLNQMGNIITRSTLKRDISKANWPVIIYHHGSQSFPFENSAMAEYFASRGYLFISANFHLPYENKQFGLIPFDRLIKGEEENSLRNVVKFAGTLTTSSRIFFIGHSWGAQMGFRSFDNDTSIKGLISLETTIELKEDFKKIEALWPEVYQKIATEKATYPFPVMMCAATGQEKPFTFFKNLNAAHLTFVSTKEQFEHNAYTSAFFLRYFIDAGVKQTDKAILLDRLNLYTRHLEMMKLFLESCDTNERKPENVIIYIR